MNDLLQQLKADYPDIAFVVAEHFSWSAAHKRITYEDADSPENLWNLLHELGHGILEHSEYSNDIDLLMKEVAAWDKGLNVAQSYTIDIDPVHVQDCLDSYRDWIFKRSSCPLCRAQGIQRSSEQYLCLNCANTWVVTKSRFCRPYRRAK